MHRQATNRLARSANQAPAYFDGNRTEICLRPFRRRRLRTARPHFVSIRAMNPCLRMRRVLRGRYVGLPMVALCVRRRDAGRLATAQ